MTVSQTYLSIYVNTCHLVKQKTGILAKHWSNKHSWSIMSEIFIFVTRISSFCDKFIIVKYSNSAICIVYINLSGKFILAKIANS